MIEENQIKIIAHELKSTKEASKPKILEEILRERHPNTEIFIIRGRDNFSYEDYTKDAYFEKEVAYNAMNKIPPNGTLPDTYQVHTETPITLNNSKEFDGFDRIMIYEKLINNYFGEQQ
jgi:hypothetical protein